jgi:hypothetical protein
MKQSQQEQTIKQLYQRSREADEAAAPSFAHAWEAARLRMRKPRSFPLFKFAAAAFVLAIFAGSWWLGSSWLAPEERLIAPTTSVPFVSSQQKPDIGDIDVSGHSGGPVEPSRSNGIRSRLRVQRRAAHMPAVLLSQWRSPTEFLMQALDDRMLKTVPTFGDSIISTTVMKPNND